MPVHKPVEAVDIHPKVSANNRAASAFGAGLNVGRELVVREKSCGLLFWRLFGSCGYRLFT